MTLEQLYTFAKGDPRGPVRQMGLTVEAARRLVSEIEAAIERESFDLSRHVRQRQPINVLHSTCEKLRGHQIERSVL